MSNGVSRDILISKKLFLETMRTMRKQFPVNWLTSWRLTFMIQCVIFFICWLRLALTHWIMKASLAEVN